MDFAPTPLPDRLLCEGDPAPVSVDNEDGRSPFLIVCDHAGNRLPQALGSLGLGAGDLCRHIAWDIGVSAVSGHLAAALDACVVWQLYSRLVIDCNRPPGVPSSIAQMSELTAIPGNSGLDARAVKARIDEIFTPYHDRIRGLIEARRTADRPTVLIAMHTFTPVYATTPRPWHAGLLYNRDARLARILLELLRAETGLVVGDNQPYSVSDAADYTIPVHGEARGLPHVGIEIRQDLVTDAAEQRRWAALLSRLLPAAYARL